MVLEVLPEKSSEGEKALPEATSDGMVPKNFPLGKKCNGVVIRYGRKKGYGWIKTKEVKKGSVYVHWEDIITDDSCPFLEKGWKVEFELGYRNRKSLARNVTLKGGKKIPIHVKYDKIEKLNEDEKFTGAITSYGGGKGYGFILPDKEINWGGETCAELFFYRDAVVSKKEKGMRPRLEKGQRVSFQVFKGPKSLAACNICNEDGTPIENISQDELDIKTALQKATKRKRIPEEEKKRNVKKRKTESAADLSIADLRKKYEEAEKELEERIMIEDGRTFTGIINNWEGRRRTGTIELDERIAHQGHTVTNYIRFDKRDSVFLWPKKRPERCRDVIFQVYMSPQGLKACKVKHVDGTPLGTPWMGDKSEDEETKKRKLEGESQRESKKIKRELVNDGKTYTGIMERWYFKKKQWRIIIKEPIEYKEHKVRKRILAHKWDLEGAALERGSEVEFKVYLSGKGLAAFEIKVVRTAAEVEEEKKKSEVASAEHSPEETGKQQPSEEQVNEESSSSSSEAEE